MSIRSALRRLVRPILPLGLLAAATVSPRHRNGALVGLAAFWTWIYTRYRRAGRVATAVEYDQLGTANWDAYWRHYNEQVPTIEEEFAMWGEFHQHRHEMRYDLVAADVRAHLPRGGVVLDVGCGSGLVADRILDLDATYLGIDFPEHHVAYVARRFAPLPGALATRFLRGDGELLPLADASVDVVVLSEVIEHLLRPERAVWEIARVLRPGGVLLMTTNNASELPLCSPSTNPLAWVEKAVGATRPSVISRRPWVWPVPVDRTLLPDGSADIYLPHTHHIQAETASMFGAAGLDTFRWTTFEFPPPQAATTVWLESRGDRGTRAVDLVEAVATRVPGLKRLGCHVFMRARKIGPPVSASPPPGIWPGPFS